MTEGGGASRSTDPASGTSSATDVSLREYLSMRVAYERSSARLLFGGVLAFGAFAWSQIQRRLEILNHENERLLQQQANTVSHDTYAANEGQRKQEQADDKEWKQKVDNALTSAVTREDLQRDAKLDRRGGWSLSAQLVAGAIGLVVFGLVLYNFAHTVRSHSPSAPSVVVVTVTTPAPTTSP